VPPLGSGLAPVVHETVKLYRVALAYPQSRSVVHLCQPVDGLHPPAMLLLKNILWRQCLLASVVLFFLVQPMGPRGMVSIHWLGHQG